MCAVWCDACSLDCGQTCAISDLAAETAFGPGAHQFAQVGIDSGIQVLGGNDGVDEADLLAREAEKRAPVRNSSRAADRPIFA